MDIRYFIGVDISKATLDWAVFDGKTIVLQTQSINSETGIKAAIKLIKTLPEFKARESVCCMEHTGIYNAHLLTYLQKISLPIWLENSLQIKKSGGLQRGKTDAIDAQRIAEYAYRFRDQMRLWQPPRPVLQKLAALSGLRQRLLLVRQQLQQPITEQEGFVDAGLQKQLAKNCQSSLKAINTDLQSVDKQVNELIQEDNRLRELFNWITSVPGVGPAIATDVIVATDEFKAISDPKKLACHAGVAPFEYKSGSSVRGKTRVNQHARLRLKSLFHLGAMSAIRMKGELQDYYQRKVGEGKNKMSALNAVRNKLIHRVCSVVNRGQNYDKNYTPRTCINHGNPCGRIFCWINQYRLPLIWCGSAIYLPLANGEWAYLGSWVDLFSRRIVGWRIDDNVEDALILIPLRSALQARQPAAGLIIHSDRAGPSLRRAIRPTRCRNW